MVINVKNNVKSSIVDEIANLTHEKFREIYRKINNGTRIKTTKDVEWIRLHNTDQSDLAKLNYFELPADWKFERYSGAKAAYNFLQKALDDGREIDNNFIEEAASIVHDEWLSRNLSRSEEKFKQSYENLNDEDKEKDRIFVTSVIEVFESK